MTAKEIKLKGIMIRQPIGEFYVVVMSAKELTEVAYADVRTLTDRDLDTYLGIQRRLDMKRVHELRSYVRSADATFPTSVLLAVESEHAQWDDSSGVLTLRSDEDGHFGEVGKILDGQHRVAGLQGYESPPPFDVCVCIFIDADMPDQASIFSTVNLAQTKVNRSLVYDLYDYQVARSPQKTSHNVALALDRLKGGPFHERIKRLGFANKPGQFLTQATVVEELLRLISREPLKDRDLLIRGKKLPKSDAREFRKTPFREMFVRGEDSNIALNVNNYFEAARSRWPNAWEGREKGQILPKTNGFKALMWGLGEVYGASAFTYLEVLPKEHYAKYFAKVKLGDNDFTTELFKPGSSGQSTLKDYLRDALVGH